MILINKLHKINTVWYIFQRIISPKITSKKESTYWFSPNITCFHCFP